MSKKKLKAHRDLHSIKVPCPQCIQTGGASYLTIICHRYLCYAHDIMWDGGSLFLNKQKIDKKKEKVYFEIYCNNGCDLQKTFQFEQELDEMLKPYLDVLFDILIKVPSPPNTAIQKPAQQSTERQYIWKLVQRQPAIVKN
ncbi:MAG TPA: hypothetical protein VI146_08530 [Nitrososphaeraceae archaeon]